MEIWDIYDGHRNRTGRTMQRNDWSMQPGDYHLTVLGLIQRGDGRYLITQRVLSKPWAPGHWEIPGGAVLAGETSAQAIVREIREETGLDVSSCPDRIIFSYRRDNPEEGDNYFVDVHLFQVDFSEADVHLQPEETMAFQIADVETIRRLGEEGVFLHYNSIKEVFST